MAFCCSDSSLGFSVLAAPNPYSLPSPLREGDEGTWPRGCSAYLPRSLAVWLLPMSGSTRMPRPLRSPRGPSRLPALPHGGSTVALSGGWAFAASVKTKH